jgi:RES domain-containing protein
LSGQKLDRGLAAFRIGDPEGAYPIFDATGSRLTPGRWNTPDTPMIYASEHYSTAMLEILANASGHLPPNQHFVQIGIEAGVAYEVFSTDHHPDWAGSIDVTRSYGERWIVERRTAVLIVPSAVARMERNILINPAHPDFRHIRAGLHQPVWWDERLFGR